MTFQNAPVLPPDAVTVVSARLHALLESRTEPHAQDVFVGDVAPDKRPLRMVLVRRDGGQVSGLFDNPRMTLTVSARRDVDDLAALVVALMRTAADGAPIVLTRHQSGPIRIQDQSGDGRRLVVFDVRTRGVQL